MLWSHAGHPGRAAGRARAVRRRPAPAPTAWVTYVRCHDDIGWAVSDADAARVGLDGFAHRRFLSDFYAGRFPGSFARGALFQENPATGDARISGTAASLCGIESALATGDAAELTLALRRLESLYAVVFSFGGMPLIYMGDELALRNDPRWARDPAHAHDNRWMHRPPMDWARPPAAQRPGDAWRAGCSPRFAGWPGPAVTAGPALGRRRPRSCPTENRSVLAYRRAHPRSAPFLSLTNFSDVAQQPTPGSSPGPGCDEPGTPTAAPEGP